MGVFNDVNDAMGQVGGLLKSPAMESVARMKDAATSLNVTANLDPYVLEQAFPGKGTDFYNQMQEIQNLSDQLDECGNFAQDLIQASTEDYIKSTGIQQAGRDLSKTLGQYGNEIDCAAGFATLFDSKGILDDVLGIGDLPQIRSRVRQIVLDATNPTKLANMITNLDAVQALLEPFNDFCTGMKDALNQLVAKDLAALNAILNKLAQWAAFTNIATGDPCALVNNNRMFNSITSPVMDDILALYAGIIGGNVGETIGEIFDPENPTALIGILNPGFNPGGFNQDAGSVVSFGSYFDGIGVNVGGIKTNIGNIIQGSQQLSDFLGDNSEGFSSEPLTWDGDAWVENASAGVIDGMSSITSGIKNFGSNSFNPALNNFMNMKEKVEFSAFGKSNESISYKVEKCVGALMAGNPLTCIKNGGSWLTTDFTPTDLGITEAIKGRVPSIDDITGGTDLFSSKTNITIPDGPGFITVSGGGVLIDESAAFAGVSLPTGADKATNKVGLGNLTGATSKVQNPTKEINRSVGSQKAPMGSSSVSDSRGSSPANPTTPFNHAIENKQPTNAAKHQTPGKPSSFEAGITMFDAGKDELKRAQESGDLRKISSCKCLGAHQSYTESHCISSGGSWKCQPGTSNQRAAKVFESINTISSSRNTELSSILPTAKAFVGIV
jgi:hypothetical protein